MIDPSIVIQAQNDNKQAFRIIFSTYKQKVFRTAFLILKDHAAAEDIVQETFLQVYVKLIKLSDPCSFEKWMYKITVNLCFEYLRKKGRAEMVSIDEDLNNKIDNFERESTSPEELAVKKELSEKIYQIINSLPPKHAAVIILYYYNDFSIKEIGDIIGCSEGTVKSRLYHARKALEELIKSSRVIIDTNTTGGALYGSR